jgi:hypothetical protein
MNDDLPTIMDVLQSEDASVETKLQHLDGLLTSAYPEIEGFVERQTRMVALGFVPLLTGFLSIDNDERITFYAVWILCNLAAQDVGIDSMIENDALPNLVRLATGDDEDEEEAEEEKKEEQVDDDGGAVAAININIEDDNNNSNNTKNKHNNVAKNRRNPLEPVRSSMMREQSLWTLVNIVQDSEANVASLLQIDGVLAVIVQSVDSRHKDVRMEAMRLMRNIVKKMPAVSAELAVFMPVCCRHLNDTDEEMLSLMLWCIVRLYDDNDTAPQEIISQLGVIVACLASKNLRIYAPAIQIVSAICVLDDGGYQVTALFQHGVLPPMLALLSSDSKTVRTNTAFTLSNMMATTDGVVEVCGAGFVEPLMNMATTDKVWAVRKEAAWAICCLVEANDAASLRTVVEKGAIPMLVDIFGVWSHTPKMGSFELQVIIALHVIACADTNPPIEQELAQSWHMQMKEHNIADKLRFTLHEPHAPHEFHVEVCGFARRVAAILQINVSYGYGAQPLQDQEQEQELEDDRAL